MKYLVSAIIPAMSSADRANDVLQKFTNKEEAMKCAEAWAKDGRKEVALWALEGRPVPKVIVEWDKQND